MLMMRRRASIAAVALVGVASACSTDSNGPRSLAAPTEASFNQSEGRGVFQRYTAIGTSVSMGVQSDGVNASTQETSWPAQLAAMGGRTLEQPLIALPGCPAPIAAPLIAGVRISGELTLANPATLGCSPLLPSVRLPVDNVAINGALTSDALLTTPEATPNPVYDRVLQPGHTQVSTMIENNPKLVSVELGVNEILGARSGVAIPGVTLVPVQTWAGFYDQILNAVQRTTKMALLVGLPSDVRNFPGLRSGNELWSERTAFALANIAVSPDCNGNSNMIFVPIKVGLALVAASQAAAQHIGPIPFSCAAGAPTDQDLTLTPGEVALVNAQAALMNAHIQAEAAKRGYAYFSLGALYDLPNLKAPFSLATTFNTGSPFGALISLDGVHPSAAGSQVLARAAANALNVTYKLGIDE
jgi:hypothetical protein